MSIKLASPSLLLNSYAFTNIFGGCGMLMDKTWNCPANTTPRDIVNWILTAAADSPGKHLANVVLHFHGDPAKVHVGQRTPEVFVPGKVWKPGTYIDIDRDSVGVFSALKGRSVGTIWLHSCSVAASFEGKLLCSKMARDAGCRVVASEDVQERWPDFINIVFMSRGSIDDYEGTVYLFKPDGTWGRFNPNEGHWN